MSAHARWAVTGSKNFDAPGLVWDALDELARVHGRPAVVVVLNRPGASRVAIDWANATGVKVYVVRMERGADGRIDKAATNARVLTYLAQSHKRGRARVIAFPGNDWTYDLTRQAHRAGLPFDRVQVNRVTGETRVAYDRRG